MRDKLLNLLVLLDPSSFIYAAQPPAASSRRRKRAGVSLLQQGDGGTNMEDETTVYGSYAAVTLCDCRYAWGFKGSATTGCCALMAACMWLCTAQPGRGTSMPARLRCQRRLCDDVCRQLRTVLCNAIELTCCNRCGLVQYVLCRVALLCFSDRPCAGPTRP